MPLVNYCRKCRAETPLGESCPYCGGKLSQTGEMISFGLMRRPVRDWFAWNNLLRVALPVWLMVFVIVLAAESAVTGAAGVEKLLTGGFLRTMIMLLIGIVLAIGVLLRLQGAESVHVILDKQGVQARTYVQAGDPMALYSRFLTEQAAEKLAADDERPELEGLTLVRRISVPWNGISRVRIWREGGTILFFRPTFWQATYAQVPISDLEEAENYVRKKMKRNKKAKVYPLMEKKNKK